MKITVFGATGQTGELLTKKALMRGYQVIAFARTPSKLSLQHHDLTIVKGDSRDYGSVELAIQGSDAVICAIAPTPQSPDDLMQKSARNIIEAMNKYNVVRLVWSTGAGVRGPEDEPTLLQKSIEALLKLVSGKVLKNAEQGVEVIRDSNLEWTIARAPMLTNNPRSGAYRVSPVGPKMNRSLSRENFAEFMLDSLEHNSYIHEMPAVSD